MEQEKNSGRERDALEEYGAVGLRTDDSDICTLAIIGQIEGHQVLPETAKTTKYEHVLPLLAAVEQSEQVRGLLLLLNTVGGDIEAGLAIAELVAGMKKPTVSLVLGGGHSIGVPLAVCAKKSFIARTISPSAASPAKVKPYCSQGILSRRPSRTMLSSSVRNTLSMLVPP